MKDEEPKKPYKNFADFRKQIGLWVSEKVLADMSYMPCPNCRGRKQVRDTKDCCPIEGYKMAPFYKCTNCNGKGSVPEKELREAYRAELRRWKEKMTAFNVRQKHRVAALKKLTAEEKKALGLC